MNAYYNGFDRRESSRKNESGAVFTTVISIIFAIIYNETFRLAIKTVLSLGAIVTLAIIVNSVKVGVLSFVPAALIALLLLGFVAFCFKGCGN